MGFFDPQEYKDIKPELTIVPDLVDETDYQAQQAIYNFLRDEFLDQLVVPVKTKDSKIVYLIYRPSENLTQQMQLASLLAEDGIHALDIRINKSGGTIDTDRIPSREDRLKYTGRIVESYLSLDLSQQPDADGKLKYIGINEGINNRTLDSLRSSYTETNVLQLTSRGDGNRVVFAFINIITQESDKPLAE